ncbi:isocitrate/isopropylmalate family dehydrogenase [Staphylococcus saprophyticus]|nr:isocitrate/isopropylmalate family dehydrogenase [Staphylococcus saprophyticus]
MSYKIVALPGDGIGPEILNGSLEILQQLSKEFHFEYELESHDFGGIAIDNHGKPLPDSTLNACKNADAILLGAVGDPSGQIQIIDQNKVYLAFVKLWVCLQIYAPLQLQMAQAIYPLLKKNVSQIQILF